jgi:MMPL family
MGDSDPGRITRVHHREYNAASSPASKALALIRDATAASGHGVTFSLGGDVVDLAETPYGGPTEGIGIMAAAMVLLIAFGSLLAMGLPIVTAVFGIGARPIADRADRPHFPGTVFLPDSGLCQARAGAGRDGAARSGELVAARSRQVHAKIAIASGPSRRSAAAINRDERSGLFPEDAATLRAAGSSTPPTAR